jgi:hypothetical protein
MSIVTCDQSEDFNPLSSNGFKFMLTRIPEITYLLQEIELPGISLENPFVKTPLSKYPVPGDMLSFDPLKIKFLVDSTMNNYRALFSWIRGLGFPDNNNQYKKQVQQGKDFYRENSLSEFQSTVSDASLIILGNTNTPIVEVKFTDCIITSLSAVEFSTRTTDVQYLLAQALFEYQSYDIKLI